MKRIYIAAPFFNPEQLALVQTMEEICANIPNMKFFSPRSIGVLKDMTLEERKAMMQKIFDGNVLNMNSCDGLIALLDHKDTGTTWELGYAYMRSKITMPRYRVFGFTSNPDVNINVMLAKGMEAHAVGFEEAREMLTAFSKGEGWETRSVTGDTH